MGAATSRSFARVAAGTTSRSFRGVARRTAASRSFARVAAGSTSRSESRIRRLVRRAPTSRSLACRAAPSRSERHRSRGLACRAAPPRSLRRVAPRTTSRSLRRGVTRSFARRTTASRSLARVATRSASSGSLRHAAASSPAATRTTHALSGHFDLYGQGGRRGSFVRARLIDEAQINVIRATCHPCKRRRRRFTWSISLRRETANDYQLAASLPQSGFMPDATRSQTGTKARVDWKT